MIMAILIIRINNIYAIFQPLTTSQIQEVLTKDSIASIEFLGVFASDNLPDIINFPASIIANTDQSSGPGEHWVGL